MKKLIYLTAMICLPLAITIVLTSCSPAMPMGGYSESLSPTVLNVTMTDNNTEYSENITAGAKYFTLLCRDGTSFRYAFTTGKVASSVAPYMTCPTNGSVKETVLISENRTVYLGCDSAGKVVEILIWGR